MGERKQPGRQRCLSVGCNPIMLTPQAGVRHHEETGHRVAAWPVRSAAGAAKARERNRTGYYDQYNVGPKSASVRFGGRERYEDTDPEGWDGHKGATG